ncbi:MAG: MATE family efflux transporter [Sulfuricurvum sp.]|jgi:putative MATE family efflux protein|uniref:MATE family efflux transporter n=1 Tax=Sulfuricurvum sp. TaxID=2025608 RepID=UPI00260014F8|nr:MATE family efflux transporter [Sulfuricurvum sp.]MCK9373869.1 MATE family efflux transporter [Sulfuricurvum sp.]
MRQNVLALAIPAAFKHLLDILQILIDLIMVGSLGAAALAAVGLSMQFMMMIQVAMTLYIVGSTALISRYIGSGRVKRGSRVMFSTAYFAIALSIVVGLSGWYFSGHFFRWMGSAEDVIVLGNRYFGILSLGMTFIFLDALAYNALSAAGDTRSSLYIKIFSAFLNAGLNYLFIFGHGGFEAMGVAGAAYATVCAYAFNLILYGWIFANRRGALGIYPVFSKNDLKKVLRIGTPAAYERSIGVGSFMLFVMIIGSYGTHAMAGYQIGLRIEALAFMPGFGFSVAAMVLAGQNIGAKKLENAYYSGILSAKVAAMFMGSVGIVLFLFPEKLASLFTHDLLTIEQASLYLRLVGISQIPLALTFVFSGALRGAGATKTTLRINTLSLWCFRIIPSYAVMGMGWEIVWVYVAMSMETFIKGWWFWRVYQKKEWLHTTL